MTWFQTVLLDYTNIYSIENRKNQVCFSNLNILSSPRTIFTDIINDLLDTFLNTVHIMLNIELQIEKIVLHFYKKIQ